jgi:hypothetical protein
MVVVLAAVLDLPALDESLLHPLLITADITSAVPSTPAAMPLCYIPTQMCTNTALSQGVKVPV